MHKRQLLFQKQLVLTKYDMDSLEPNKWIKDVVISAFFSVLQSTEKNKKILFLLTYTIHYLLGYDNTSYDYGKVDSLFETKDLLCATVIYFPINLEKSHWILGCVYPSQFRINIFDSGKWIAEDLSNGKNIDLTRAKHYGMALLYLMEDRAKHLGSHFDINKWSIVDKFCPQQTNGWDCGVSVCLIALSTSQSLPLNYNHNFMGIRRDEINYSLLMKERCLSVNVPMQEQSQESRHSFADISILDISNVGIDFTIVSRFDGTIHTSRLHINMEARQLEDKDKPDVKEELDHYKSPEDYDDQSTLSEEVGAPHHSDVELIKQDNYIKRLIKVDNCLTSGDAKKELAIAGNDYMVALRNIKRYKKGPKRNLHRLERKHC
jgi:hypothetical protein